MFVMFYKLEFYLLFAYLLELVGTTPTLPTKRAKEPRKAFMARNIAQKGIKINPLKRKTTRNEAIYYKVKNSLDRGVLSVVAEEYGISRERARQIFRREEVIKGDVFHRIVNGNARRLD